MIRKSILLSVLITTGLFAQGFSGRRTYGPANGAPGTSTQTPPTPAQLAAAQLTSIARFLKLDSADTSKLTGSTTLVGYIEAEQTALQANAAALQTAYTTLATDIATGNTKDVTVQESAIQTAVNNNFQTRVSTASQVVTALPGVGLSVTLTSAQLTSVARQLIGGGGGGGFPGGMGGGRGRF